MGRHPHGRLRHPGFVGGTRVLIVEDPDIAGRFHMYGTWKTWWGLKIYVNSTLQWDSSTCEFSITDSSTGTTGLVEVQNPSSFDTKFPSGNQRSFSRVP